MYFFRKKSPSGHALQLLESYRNADGQPRTRVVASLGDIKYDDDDRVAIAREVEAQLYQRPELLPPTDFVAREADRIVKLVIRRGRWQETVVAASKTKSEDLPTIDGVLLEGISHSHSSTLGPELLGLFAWRELAMDRLLAELGFNGSQQQAACIQVIGRLVNPSSELGLAERFLDSSSLPDLLGVESETLSSADRYYRVSDKLLKNRKLIESHSRQIIQKRFSLTRTYYLYDLTNTHFEGLAQLNPKAKRGNSKQKRNDCPLVAAGLCFDEYGFVLFHKTFSGNTHDSVTLPEMVRQMQECSQEDDLLSAHIPPVVVIDGGLATEDNLAVLRQEGFRYLVNRSRAYRGKFQEEFAQDEHFSPVDGRKPGKEVLVRQIPAPEGNGDQLVLCLSQQRAKKEEAIRSRAEERFVAELKKLQKRIAGGRLKDPKKIQQAIGRKLAQHPRVARFYLVTVDEEGQLQWQRNDEKLDAFGELDGGYVLQTNVDGMSASELWQSYITLTRAEAGFRALKSDLGLRPNFHHLEHRVDGHIFITILAYQLMRYITFCLESHGDLRSWPVLRQLMQTHCYATLTIPTTAGLTYRKRCPGQPEAAQRMVYKRLKIEYDKLPHTLTKHSES